MRLLLIFGVLALAAGSAAALYLGVRWARRVQDRRAIRAERRERQLAAVEDYRQRSALEDLDLHRKRINRNLDDLHDS